MIIPGTEVVICVLKVFRGKPDVKPKFSSPNPSDTTSIVDQVLFVKNLLIVGLKWKANVYENSATS